MTNIPSFQAFFAPEKRSPWQIGATGLVTLLLSSGAHAVSCDFKNGDHFTEICGYVETSGAQIGGQMKVHVASTTPGFDVHVRRAGNDNPTLQTYSFGGAGNHNPGTTGYNGLNWGSAYSVSVPSDWTSGIYELSFNNGRGDYSEFVAIRSNQPGSHSKVLVLDSLPTKIAYSPIGGKSMYGFNSTNGQASAEVSMERPTGRGQWTEHREFVTWLDKKGIPYEAASMLDLHRDPSLLGHYNLVILIGHNEYWSKEMRDNWDNYLAAGGNGAIFSGNTMWWQVRFSTDYKRMICYKNAASDPMSSQDSSRVTVNWSSPPLNRPENLSTGVSFRHGGYHNYTENGVQYYVKNGNGDDGSNGGFRVTDPSHWAFANTGLSNGSVFGRNHDIAGYEMDGALFQMINGKPAVTGADGTPTNFQILATAPAYAVNSPSGIPGVVYNGHNGQGWGTIGIFKPSSSSGSVFVAPTIDWAEGLVDAQVSRITENVINRLKNRVHTNTNNGTNTGGTGSGTTNNTGGSSGTTADTSNGTSTSTSGGTPTSVPSGTEQVVVLSRNDGGAGSLPFAALLLGMLAVFGLKTRKP